MVKGSEGVTVPFSPGPNRASGRSGGGGVWGWDRHRPIRTRVYKQRALTASPCTSTENDLRAHVAVEGERVGPGGR